MLVKNKEKPNQFIFESESKTPAAHNKLLNEISLGVKLKKTKTNDRSKPNLEGLRKFRRQMTIEEQVQKSMSQANLLAASPSGASVSEINNQIVSFYNPKMANLLKFISSLVNNRILKIEIITSVIKC